MSLSFRNERQFRSQGRRNSRRLLFSSHETNFGFRLRVPVELTKNIHIVIVGLPRMKKRGALGSRIDKNSNWDVGTDFRNVVRNWERVELNKESILTKFRRKARPLRLLCRGKTVNCSEPASSGHIVLRIQYRHSADRGMSRRYW